MTPDDRFEQCKRENLNTFNFTRVITCIRAVKFGWARFNNDKSSDWFLTRCVEFATDVMDSAYNLAIESDEESFCECGGFRAIARPNGRVWLQFILESRGEFWDEEDDEQQSTARIGELFTGTTQRRRILKLHKET